MRAEGKDPQRLPLLSGYRLLEARNEQGEPLGFPRVESLLSAGVSAKALAEAPQHHGQNDDVILIGIARTS